jgi:UrcA family protein
MATSATKVISTSVLAIILSGAASHAMAGPKPDFGPTPSVTVRFGDLNTASPEGIKTLYSRIRAAADGVCTKEVMWYPAAFRAQKACYRATLESVVAKLNLSGLTALHRATVGEPRPEPRSVLNR